MEILIIGILLVALMVFVSTRIKRNAAAAYEPESIETGEFSLTKPEGLLYPLRNDSEFAFEAYSNDYGDDNLRSIWQMQSTLKVYPDKKFKEICTDIKKSADKVLSEELVKTAPADQRICLLETERTDDGVKYREFWKIVESLTQKRIYELRVALLDNHLREKSWKAAELIGNFAVK